MPLPLTDKTINEVYEQISDEFIAYMATNLPDVQLAFDNVDFDPEKAFPVASSSDAFARFTLFHTDASQQNLGATFFRRQGIVMVQCFVRKDTARLLSNTIVDSVLRFFEITKVAGMWFRAQTPSEAGDDGAWYQVNVVNELTYDVLRT